MSPPLYRGDILFLSWMSVLPSVCLSQSVSAPHLQDSLKDFHETWVTCSPHQGDIKSRIRFHFHNEDQVINKLIMLD